MSSFLPQLESWIFMFLLVHSGRLSNTANIIFYNGLGEGSHFLAAAAIAEELVDRGHRVTFLVSSVYSERLSHPVFSKKFNFLTTPISDNITHNAIKNRFNGFVEAGFNGTSISYIWENIGEMMQFEINYCQDLFTNEQLLSTLKEVKFDAMVLDPVWGCSVTLCEYLEIPLKFPLMPTSYSSGHARLYGNDINPSWNPVFGHALPSKMNFLERIKNTLLNVMDRLFTSFYLERPFLDIFKQHNISQGMLHSYRTSSLYFTATDPLIDVVISSMPHTIAVGGLTTKPAKTLEQELESFMQSSGEHGVIVFSLGSYVTHMPDEKVKIFAEAFARLDQKVIWQWKNKEEPAWLGDNILTMKWLPQNDLLGHNKTRMLFYQGGNNGLYEAIYHGVPLLVCPLIGDQPDVAQRVVERGIGEKIDVTTVTSDSLYEIITNVLNDPSYKEKAMLMSAMFRDRPQTPRQKAAYWIEHVLKFGADHLRSPVHDLSFIQLNLIDVFAFLALCVVAIVCILYFTLKLLFRTLSYICCNKKRKTD